MNNYKNNQYLQGLNEQQKEAVLCHADILYVSAAPGSGKTFLLTSKLIDYIESSSTPQKIVALSFTNTAAQQLGDRFQKKIDDCGVRKDYTFINGTIHSFCFRMMKAYHADMAKSFDYIILDEEELQELATDIEDHFNGRYSQGQILSCLRSSPKESGSELFSQISALKESYKVISMQDILRNFISLVEHDAGFQEWIKDQITVIAVDEAQDLSEMNFIILDRLIGVIPGLKILLVGDPRQNIFEFNGGSYKHLDNFLTKHRNHETRHLTITYRCSQAISDYVNTFHFTDCDNEQLKSRYADAGKVIVKNAISEDDEAEQVLRSIREIQNLNSCAILCNNLKYLDPLFAKLQKERIPYKVFGGRRTVKKPIRFLNHILRIFDNDNAYSIRKVAQHANIDIMENGKYRKSKFFESDLGQLILSIRETTEGMSFVAVMAQVIAQIIHDPEDGEISEEYDKLLAIAGEYESISDYLVSFATDRERFAPFYEKGYQECLVPNEEIFLTISTIHSAKGLEWKHVFIMGLSEGNFPNPFFCQGLPPDQQREFYNGEWKKMYVASTRAKETLFLTYSSHISRKGYTFRKDPSRFIPTSSNTAN